MSEIKYHQKDDIAVTKDNSFTGKQPNTPKKTIKGWDVNIEWKGETKIWVDIKDVKEASQIDLADYVVANMIADDQAFDWWVPYALKKRNIIVSKVKKNYWGTTHKYGVRLPDNVTEAMHIDQ